MNPIFRTLPLMLVLFLLPWAPTVSAEESQVNVYCPAVNDPSGEDAPVGGDLSSFYVEVAVSNGHQTYAGKRVDAYRCVVDPTEIIEDLPPIFPANP